MTHQQNILTVPRSLSTSRRQSGEDEEVMINVTLEVQMPDDEKATVLFRATRTGQALYLSGVLGHLSSMRSRRAKEGEENLTVVFAVPDPRLQDVGKLYAHVRDFVPVELCEAQGALDMPEVETYDAGERPARVTSGEAPLGVGR